MNLLLHFCLLLCVAQVLSFKIIADEGESKDVWSLMNKKANKDDLDLVFDNNGVDNKQRHLFENRLKNFLYHKEKFYPEGDDIYQKESSKKQALNKKRRWSRLKPKVWGKRSDIQDIKESKIDFYGESE